MAKRREHRIYEFEDFRLDAAHLLLYRDDQQVSLTPKAIETLIALLERGGEVISKHDLMETIWADTVVEESNLAQYLHLLRKTLGKRHDGTQFIETLKRRGYRFNGDVRVLENALVLPEQPREDPPPAGATFSNVESGGTNVSDHGRRVERRGNVLALVDWQENKKELTPEPAKDLPPAVQVPDRSAFRSTIQLTAVALSAALLLTAVSVIWLNSRPDERPAAARGDLTFLNLTNGEHFDFATISPDGSYFVFTLQADGSASLWLQQTRQASRMQIVPPFEGAISGTTFSPDSQFVYFIANEKPGSPNDLYRVPSLGGVRTRILSDIDTPVSVSPDGREIVFRRYSVKESRSSLIIASSDGKHERTLLTRTGNEAIQNGGAWSPDGSMIAFGEANLLYNGQCAIMGIDLNTRETRKLSPEMWDTCFRMAWTGDGQGLVFNGTRSGEAPSTKRDQIFYLSIANGEAHRLTAEGNRHQFASLGVTNRDEILAVPFKRPSQIWSLDAGGDSRTAVQITKGQADGRGGIDALTDGTISYLTRNGDGFSIWLTNADGTGRRQLTTDPPAIEELRSAPDGRFFVFAATVDSFSHLYRIDAAGGDLRQLTFGESKEIDSAVSPDGNWVAYDSRVFEKSYGRSALWKVSSEGGEPIRLADVECTTPHFSPDGNFVSCVSPDWAKIFVISVTDGTTVKSFDTEKNSILSAGSRWTRDGKTLAYIVSRNNVGNIWLQPVNGDERYPLTDFTSGDIYNFAFGADARLYMARGHPSHAAVLISNFR